MPPRYTTAAAYRAYADLPDDTGKFADAAIEPHLEEAEDWLEWRCATEFGPSAPATRDYWGEGIGLLKIDPCYEVAAVQVVAADGTTEAVDAGSYAAVPPLGAGGVVQHTHLLRLPRDRRGWAADCLYRVEARYGMAATPAGFTLAVMEFAAIRRLESIRAKGAPMLGDEDPVSAVGNRIVERYLDRWVQPDAWNPRTPFRGATGRR